MGLDLDQNRATYQIRSFKPGEIQVNERFYTKSIIISANQLIENWQPQSVNELTPASFSAIVALKPDILLIGTGPTHIFLAINLYGELINHGIGVEIMETGAACRTYNALTAEERKVVAALLLK